MTIELDYAFLADYAQVVGGKLTAVGASFTEVKVPQVPFNLQVALAGRIRASENTERVRFVVEIVPPENAYEFKAEGLMTVTEPVRPYNGKLGLLLAANISVPIVGIGLYVVNLHLEGDLARRLAFGVEV